MSVLELNDEHVISIVRQLQAARRGAALLALAQDAQVRREECLQFGEAQLRRLCAERRLDWNRMPEENAKSSWMICSNNRGHHR